MSEEYEYGPWTSPPEGGCIQLDNGTYKIPYFGRYRIATPKPKRELVVGKWYRTKWRGEWFQCLFVEGEYLGGYFRKHKGDDIAEWRGLDQIDWSVSPRDTAPEGQS